MDNKQLMIYALGEDAERFKELQKEYKKKGMNSAALFHDLIKCYNTLMGGF